MKKRRIHPFLRAEKKLLGSGNALYQLSYRGIIYLWWDLNPRPRANNANLVAARSQMFPLLLTEQHQ